MGTSGNEDARAIAIDNLDAIYISGFTSGDFVGINLGQNDIIAAKFDHIGNLIWQRQIGTAAADIGYAMGTYSNGVFIAGAAGGALDGASYSGGDYDVFLIKYDLDGSLQ